VVVLIAGDRPPVADGGQVTRTVAVWRGCDAIAG